MNKTQSSHAFESERRQLCHQILSTLTSEDYEQCQSLLYEYYSMVGLDVFYVVTMTDYLYCVKQYGLCIEWIDLSLLDFDPVNSYLYYRLGDCFFELSDFPQARHAYVKALDLSSSKDESMLVEYKIGLVHLACQEFEKAIQSFEDVLLDKNAPFIYTDLAKAYLCMGDYERMFDAYMLAFEQHPQSTKQAIYQALGYLMSPVWIDRLAVAFDLSETIVDAGKVRLAILLESYDLAKALLEDSLNDTFVLKDALYMSLYQHCQDEDKMMRYSTRILSKSMFDPKFDSHIDFYLSALSSLNFDSDFFTYWLHQWNKKKLLNDGILMDMARILVNVKQPDMIICLYPYFSNHITSRPEFLEWIELVFNSSYTQKSIDLLYNNTRESKQYLARALICRYMHDFQGAFQNAWEAMPNVVAADILIICYMKKGDDQRRKWMDSLLLQALVTGQNLPSSESEMLDSMKNFDFFSKDEEDVQEVSTKFMS